MALHLRDPHEPGSWGACPTALLGFWCPGCGGLRAVHDLTRLRLDEAASSNLALVSAAPLLAVWLAWWAWRRWRGDQRPVPRTTWLPLLLGAAALVVAFTALRNTAAGEWLAP